MRIIYILSFDPRCTWSASSERAGGGRPRPHPGRRTIYDASFHLGDDLLGVDLRTKDLAAGRYSDGGLCAVGNLLRFMVRDGGILLVTEVGYTIASGAARFEYVITAPVHGLPFDVYRIENLGTGQLRLNRSIRDCAGEIEWRRSPPEFFERFAPLCMDHCRRVKQQADARIGALAAFVSGGYLDVRLK